MDQTPKHKPKTIKLLEEKIKEKLPVIGFGNVFLDLTQKKAKATKVKIVKLDYIKI